MRMGKKKGGSSLTNHTSSSREEGELFCSQVCSPSDSRICVMLFDIESYYCAFCDRSYYVVLSFVALCCTTLCYVMLCLRM
jgi:hypothetical protein